MLIARPDRVAELAPALEAIEDGIETARADLDAAAERIADAEDAGDVGLIRAQVDAISDSWAVGLDGEILAAWAAFDARVGIVEEMPDVSAAFDLTLVR